MADRNDLIYMIGELYVEKRVLQSERGKLQIRVSQLEGGENGSSEIRSGNELHERQPEDD
jgi:hypothetical protein